MARLYFLSTCISALVLGTSAQATPSDGGESLFPSFFDVDGVMSLGGPVESAAQAPLDTADLSGDSLDNLQAFEALKLNISVPQDTLLKADPAPLSAPQLVHLPPVDQTESVLVVPENKDPLFPSPPFAEDAVDLHQQRIDSIASQRQNRAEAEKFLTQLKESSSFPWWKRWITSKSTQNFNYLQRALSVVTLRNNAPVQQAMLTLLYEDVGAQTSPQSAELRYYDSPEQAMAQELETLNKIIHQGHTPQFEQVFSQAITTALASMEGAVIQHSHTGVAPQTREAHEQFSQAYAQLKKNHKDRVLDQRRGQSKALALGKKYIDVDKMNAKENGAYIERALKVGRSLKNAHERYGFYSTISTSLTSIPVTESTQQKNAKRIADLMGANQLELLIEQIHEEEQTLQDVTFLSDERQASQATYVMELYTGLLRSLVTNAPLHDVSQRTLDTAAQQLPKTLLQENHSLNVVELQKALRIIQGLRNDHVYLAPPFFVQQFQEAAQDAIQTFQVKKIEKSLAKKRLQVNRISQTQAAPIAAHLIDRVMSAPENVGWLYNGDAYFSNYERTLRSIAPYPNTIQAEVIRQLQLMARQANLGKQRQQVFDLLNQAQLKIKQAYMEQVPVVAAEEYTPFSQDLVTSTSHVTLLTQEEALSKADLIINGILPHTDKRTYYSRFYEDIFSTIEAEQNPQIKAALQTKAAQIYYAGPAKTPVKSGYTVGALYGWKSSILWWTPARPTAQTAIKERLQVPLNTNTSSTLPTLKDIIERHYVNNQERRAYEDAVTTEVYEAAQKSTDQMIQTHGRVVHHTANLEKISLAMRDHLTKNLNLRVSKEKSKKPTATALVQENNAREGINRIISNLQNLSSTLRTLESQKALMTAHQARTHLAALHQFEIDLDKLPQDIDGQGHLSQLRVQAKNLIFSINDHLKVATHHETVHTPALVHLKKLHLSREEIQKWEQKADEPSGHPLIIKP